MKNLIRPQSTWKDLETHYLTAINDEWYKCLVELQNLIFKYTYMFYEEKNIKNMFLPITTGSISSPMGLGSDSIPVKVNLFGVETYLSDSMQFLLEYGSRFCKDGVWYIMPSFRGEKEDKRHLSQFYHSESEIPGNLEDVMLLVEEYIKFLSKNILDDYGDVLLKINGDNTHIEHLIKLDTFPKVTFEEAIKILDYSNEFIETHEEGFRTINSDGEKELIKHFGGVVWLKNFDSLAVPFYQATINEGKYAKNADLLFGMGEVVGSGERHKTGKEVEKALKIHNVRSEEYSWYIEMKNKYPMKTSGFGMGIERFILWLIKHDDIRDCQILPRFNGINIVP